MVKKRELPSGRIDWYYKFDLPGSSREKRLIAREYGYATKKAAQDAETARRVVAKATESAPLPKTVRALLDEFFADCGELAAKTVERYKQLAEYLSPEIQAMPISEVTALHLHREWKRLAECGGRHRKTKEARPLGAKTVRHICGVVSSAFGRAELWGLVKGNPTRASKPPKVQRREGIALAPNQTQLMIEAARIAWMPAFLELDAATGCRRGELLALEWTDLDGNTLTIARSLSQTKAGLEVKCTKSEKPRKVTLSPSALSVLAKHRKAQDEAREHYGTEYMGSLIFANQDGTPLRPDSVSSAVSLLCRRLKMPKGASLHTLRHSHLSQLIVSGVPIPVVAARAGHSTPQTTMRIYAHLLEGRNQDEDAAAKWEEFQTLDPTKGVRQ